MKAYKVVRRFGNQTLVSATAYSTLIKDNGICVTYVPKKYVKPVLANSLLFCFTDLDSAQDFAKERSSIDGNYEVWEAEIKHKTTRGIFAFQWNVKNAWAEVMKLVRSHKKIALALTNYGNSNASDKYQGTTVWAAQVKLTKLISKH